MGASLPRKTPDTQRAAVVDVSRVIGFVLNTVGGEVKFACVDGPDFDGHKVDFAELMNRNGVYKERETEERSSHACRLQKLGEELIK